MSNYEFYLVLPSNSSMKYFSNNSTTCFTTHLPQEIRLHGDWCVGLAEIHIPCTIPHITRNGRDVEFSFYTSKDVSQETPPIKKSLKYLKEFTTVLKHLYIV